MLEINNFVLAALVLVIWTSLGASTVIFFFARHGRRSLLWYPIGLVLGPILIPIAAEMERRGEPLLRWDTDGPARPDPGKGLRVLVAVDGSLESDRAVREVGRMFTGPETHFLLLTVLDPDRSGTAAQREAQVFLRECASRFDELPASVECEVVAGDPVPVILETAVANDVGLIVMGRRGKGLSRRILGSVATRVVTGAPGAVLLGPSVTAYGHQAEQEPLAEEKSTYRRGDTP